MTEENRTQGRIILGSGRSGTTWVQDCLALANRLRPIFEPLHEGESALGKQFAYRMLIPGDDNRDLEQYFRDLSGGRITSLWIDYRARRKILFPERSKLSTLSGIRGWAWVWKKHLNDRVALIGTRQRPETLIKCIRANLMASWLVRDLGFRAILLVRHPCASIASQLKRPSTWNPEPVAARYRSDRRLHEATGGVYLPLLNSRLSPLQALTVNWVIENKDAVAQASQYGYHVAFYEHLISSPAIAWPTVCVALGLKTPPSTGMLRQPSQQTYNSLAKHALENDTPGWQRALSHEQLRAIQAVLDATECELYNIHDPLPFYSGFTSKEAPTLVRR